MSDKQTIELEHDPDLGPYDPGADNREFEFPLIIPTPNYKGKSLPRTWEEGKQLGWDDASLESLAKAGIIDVPLITPTKNYKGKPLPQTWQEGKRLGWDDATLETLLKYGIITSNPLLQDVTGASMSDRLELTFRLIGRHVGPEVAEQLKSAAPWIAGTAAVWAAGHFFGVSQVVDMILLTFGMLALGPQVLTLSDDLYAYFTLVENARTVHDLDRASAILSRVITTVGITAFLALVGGNKKVSIAKNSVAWKLQAAGRGTLPSRWPGSPPASTLFPPDVFFGSPRAPVRLVAPGTRRLGGLQAIEAAARKAGMTVAEFEYVMAVAARHGVHIYVRPAGAGTPRLRASGALAKREWMKMNTVSADDIAIGAPFHARDKVAHFKPKPWKEIEPKIPAADRARVKARWEKRLKSFQDYDQVVQENISKGKIRLGEGGVLYDAQTGRPHTADVDFFEYRATDGRTLQPYETAFKAIQNDLERGPTFAQHQTHRTWKPEGPAEHKIFWDIVVRHGANEPLIWLQPTGHASLYYADLPMCWR